MQDSRWRCVCPSMVVASAWRPDLRCCADAIRRSGLCFADGRELPGPTFADKTYGNHRLATRRGPVWLTEVPLRLCPGTSPQLTCRSARRVRWSFLAQELSYSGQSMLRQFAFGCSRGCTGHTLPSRPARLGGSHSKGVTTLSGNLFAAHVISGSVSSSHPGPSA